MRERNESMGTMPVFSVHGFHGEGKTEDCIRSCLSDSMLPVFYMGDYSILGLLVDDLPRALKILLEKDLLVSEGTLTKASQVESGNLQEIIYVLHQERIGCEIADIIKEVYQG
jgi:hypothetical protein